MLEKNWQNKLWIVWLLYVAIQRQKTSTLFLVLAWTNVFPSEFSFLFLREIWAWEYSILFTLFSKFPVREQKKIFAGLTKFQPQMVSKRPDGSAQCTLCGSVYSSAFTARTHVIRKHVVPQRRGSRSLLRFSHLTQKKDFTTFRGFSFSAETEMLPKKFGKLMRVKCENRSRLHDPLL